MSLFNEQGKLPCISLWEPWASWVMLGWKTIETRTHDRFRTLEGRTIGIHASKRWDWRAVEAARKWLTLDQQDITHDVRKWAQTHGRILCTAKVNDFRPSLSFFDEPAAMIECSSTDRSGLILVDVKPLPILNAPIIKGGQGIFYVDANTVLSQPHICRQKVQP